MKMITATELNNCLASHKFWVETRGKQGTRAYLRDADLRGADLKGADLTGANLHRANLTGANLYVANLEGADLWDANLTGANLRGANLTGAILLGANLSDANLRDAHLSGAILRDADLTGADLTGTIIEKKKEQGTTMILSEEETAVILKMRADKVNQAKIDARDIVIKVITLVTNELSRCRPSNADIMRTDDCDKVLGSENLETISLILDLMGVKFQALTANRRAINFSYKKLNSL
jgi:uncharacterized protein YjbI with pentapeptide repeats